MKIEDIIIPYSFFKSHPRPEKVEKCLEHWKKYGEQDRDIIVTSDRKLIDGYIMYLVLKQCGVKEAKVLVAHNVEDNKKVPYYKNHMTTYVYGVHANNPDKEYVWRVPNSWTNWAVEVDVHIGDKLLVKTQLGLKVVTVTKIEVLDKPPIDMNIRKVYKKLYTEEV